MKISFDGGGVFPDEFISDGDRLRLSFTGEGSEDVTLYVEDGELHIFGQYTALLIDRVEANHVALHTVPPGCSTEE
jgi:hypothetical protein